jgi:hypothetical protein
MMTGAIQILNWIAGAFGAMIPRVGDIGIS